jgi:hypothetical protein
MFEPADRSVLVPYAASPILDAFDAEPYGRTGWQCEHCYQQQPWPTLHQYKRRDQQTARPNKIADAVQQSAIHVIDDKGPRRSGARKKLPSSLSDLASSKFLSP